VEDDGVAGPERVSDGTTRLLPVVVVAAAAAAVVVVRELGAYVALGETAALWNEGFGFAATFVERMVGVDGPTGSSEWAFDILDLFLASEGNLSPLRCCEGLPDRAVGVVVVVVVVALLVRFDPCVVEWVLLE
jgi:hypothetical protein